MAGLVAWPPRTSYGIGLAALLVLFGCEGLQDAAADGDARTLTMHHIHTGEDITITYKRNGRYDDEALKKINWFLRDWRKNEDIRMDPRLLDLVWEVYRELDGKEPIRIICGFRSPATNAMLRRRSRGVAQFSQHTLGKAMDFAIPGVSLEQLRYAGLRMQRGGVGFYSSSGFVHLDTGSVRHWPRMAPDLLARVMRGKTIQVADRSGAEKRTRNPLAKLFGIGGQEEDDEADATPGADQGRPPATTVAATAQPTANVPLPHARPAQTSPAAPIAQAVPVAPAAPAGGFELASASSTPVDIGKSRTWRTVAAAGELPPVPPGAIPHGPPAQAPDSGAIGLNGERFVWLAGPPGQPVARPDAGAGDTTASVSPWQKARNDRIPSELALAYAAAVAPEPVRRGNATIQLRPAATPPPAPTPPRATTTPAPVRPGQRVDDPWLRSVVLAPSVHYSMNVSIIGTQDYRTFTRFMHKPSSVMAMVFSADPYFGMTSASFAGSAISFMPTVTFVTRTAGLN